MVRVITNSPVGDEFYPARVVRPYFKIGALVATGDALYDLEGANGEALHVRSNHSGRVATAPFEAGAHVSSHETLVEVDVLPDHQPEGPLFIASSQNPTTTRSKRVDVYTPVDRELYPANMVKAHAQPGDWVESESVLYTIEAATGAEVALHVPVSGRLISSNDALNLVRRRAIAVIETDAKDPQAKALGEAQGVYLLADGVFASDESDPSETAPAAHRDPTKFRTILIANLAAAIALLAVGGWYLLSYLPFQYDNFDADSYYGQRIDGEPLGGRRKFFTLDEQQKGFESWLNS